MIGILSSLFPRRSTPKARPGQLLDSTPPSTVQVGNRRLDIGGLISTVDGLAHLDWNRVQTWCDAMADQARGGEAWLDCERAWLLHLRDALGGNYRLFESDIALLLTCQDDRRADLTLDFIARTHRRVLNVLGRVAEPTSWGREILVLFEDTETYYRYVAAFESPDEADFVSAGMFINHGCGHFVAVDGDLGGVEPVIAHEMSHALVSHLPLPTWLDEGMAVNAEQHLTDGAADAWQQQELMRRHRAYWSPDRIQGFWSGKSYVRADEGSELSYDLGRILVAAMSSERTRFEAFALSAQRSDAGDAAARQSLGIDLGAYVASLLDAATSEDWGPRPEAWQAPSGSAGPYSVRSP